MAWATAGAVFVAGPPARAHHSMIVYEAFPTTIEGTVQQFKFVNPHSIIVLKGSAPNGHPVVWFLEGDAPAMLDRDGFSRNTFHPGDRLKLIVHRLKSGQSGGLWSIRTVLEQNGHEFAGHQCVASPDHCNPQ
ncbi:MAG TPA: DUF6152 family protein [Xanthobacteraceae bacterium]|nr:DUF6152 family protein [Xanthobacteraceae bacterium]